MDRVGRDTAIVEGLDGPVDEALREVLVEGRDADREPRAWLRSVTRRIVSRTLAAAALPLRVVPVLLVQQLLVERQALVVELWPSLSRLAFR